MKLRSPLLGFLGLVALGLVAVKLVQGDLSVSEASLRIGVVAAALLLTEKLLLPIAKTLVASGRPQG